MKGRYRRRGQGGEGCRCDCPCGWYRSDTGEGGIRSCQHTLPGQQIELVTKISKLGKPVVMVLLSGGMMSLGPLKAAIPAIIAAPYGGEMGATALSHVLFGTYNPSGKLAATMYPPDYINQLPLTDMSLTTPPGRTHLFYTGTPEYAFGDGLSYTTWELEWETRPPAKWKAMVEEEEEERVKFSVRVRNTGSRAGRRTVLVFARPVDAGGGGWPSPQAEVGCV